MPVSRRTPLYAVCDQIRAAAQHVAQCAGDFEHRVGRLGCRVRVWERDLLRPSARAVVVVVVVVVVEPVIIVDQTLENENHMLKKGKKNKSTMGVSLKQMQQVRLLPRFYSFKHVHIDK